jgi:GNAT superfamily N-acetyltransferase
MLLNFRRINESDDLVEITELIHAAYAPHAALGLKYWGTHQTVADTEKRFKVGIGFIAEENGKYVGTATIRPPQKESKVDLYNQHNVWSLAQFCISPKCKGKGYGKALHSHVAMAAIKNGAEILALDTAKPASGLIAMYQAWGYTIVGECDWRPHTNYMSLLMALPLNTHQGKNAPNNSFRADA